MSWSTKTAALIRKEVALEMRGRDTLPPMIAFAGTVTVLLAFALATPARLSAPASLPAGTLAASDVLAGFFWITTLFAGLIGFARTFEAEGRLGALEAMLLVPVDRTALFVAKAVANLGFIVVVQLVLVPAFVLLFGIDTSGQWLTLTAVVLLVDVGFAATGTLLAAVAAGTRSRELLLPILAFPLLVPAFIAAVELSSDLFVGRSAASVAGRGWFAILIAFDIVVTVVASLTFEYALDQTSP